MWSNREAGLRSGGFSTSLTTRPLLDIGPAKPVDSRLQKRIEAQLHFVQAALCPGATNETVALCLRLQSELLRDLNGLFKQTHPHNESPPQLESPDTPLHLEEQGRLLAMTSKASTYSSSEDITSKHSLSEEVYSSRLMRFGSGDSGSSYIASSGSESCVDDPDDDFSSQFFSGSDSECEALDSQVGSQIFSPQMPLANGLVTPEDGEELQEDTRSLVKQTYTDELALMALSRTITIIQQIFLGNYKLLTEKTFSKLVERSENLEVIVVKGTQIDDHYLGLLADKSRDLEFLTLPSRRVGQDVLQKLAAHGGMWKVLDIGFTGASEEVIHQFLRQPQQLQLVDLRGTEASEETVELLNRNCSQLRFLRLGDIDVDESLLYRLVYNNPNLEKLLLGASLKGNCPLLEAWIRTARPNLQLTYQTDVPSDDEEQSGSKRQRTQNEGAEIASQGTFTLSDHLPEHPDWSDTGYVSRPSSSSTYDDLAVERALADATWPHFNGYERAFYTDKRAFELLSQCRGSIRFIDCVGCKKLTDRTFSELVNKSEGVRWLLVSGTQISDDNLRALVKRLEYLYKLSLPQRRIPNDILSELADKAGECQELDISGTGASVDVVRQLLAYPAFLEVVDLMGTEVDAQAVAHLAEGCRNLTSVSFGQIEVDEAVLRRLVTNNPNLKKLYVGASGHSESFLVWMRKTHPGVDLSDGVTQNQSPPRLSELLPPSGSVGRTPLSPLKIPRNPSTQVSPESLAANSGRLKGGELSKGRIRKKLFD